MDNPWRYFKIGDVVTNETSFGKKKRFVIISMRGNSYCPLIDVHPIFKEKVVCTFIPSLMKLVDSPNRPFRRLKRDVLLKVNKKGNVEAKREITMRLYNKEF